MQAHTLFSASELCVHKLRKLFNDLCLFFLIISESLTAVKVMSLCLCFHSALKYDIFVFVPLYIVDNDTDG